MTFKTLSAAWFAAIFIAQSTQAQISSPTSSDRIAGPEPVTPALEARQRLGDLRVDGRLDEEAWLRTPMVSGFVQGEPIEGAPAEEQTEVRVLFDDQALYVGVILYEADPGRIGDQLVRRDAEGQYDYFEISIDPNNDRRTGYLFRVSAAGVQRDVYLYDDTRTDANWDAVWESAVSRRPDGWSVELRIPLSQIRYDPSDAVQSWGINFKRSRVAVSHLTSHISRLDGLN